MSNTPEIRLDLEDLEQHFLPAWAKESAEPGRYAAFEGRREGEGRRGGPREGRPRREFQSRPEGGRESGRPGRGPRGPGGGPRRPGDGRRPDRGPRPQAPVEPPEPLLELNIALVPDEKGVESIARQIRLTGRAYPVFDIAQLILRKPDRYQAVVTVIKKPDGQVAQPLWICSLDETLWLSDSEAAAHALKKHFDLFYKEERKPTDPPKGVYTFVAQCGLSGVVLGPPNYHDYQVKLRKLHAERFSRMPFEAYRSRVRIVKDEAVVKKWVEDQSWKSEFVALNVTEPLTLPTREDVERHFREVHQANVVRQVERHAVGGAAAQQMASMSLRRAVRRAWEEQTRFPLKVVTILSQQFAGHGLHFFKVNKTVTHVAVARPHYLDLEATPVSDGIRRIVDYVHAHPGCTRRQLLDTLAPRPPTPPAAPPGTEEGEAGAPATPPPAPEPTAEQTAVVADLHWLIHQGHVLEFANGRMETAKKPLPKPPPKPPAVPAKPAQVGATSNQSDPPTATGQTVSESSTETTPVAEPLAAAESAPDSAQPQGVPGSEGAVEVPSQNSVTEAAPPTT